MLGRFLEISLHTPEIQESLRFYERLGFVQAPVGETWTHPYAVVTDGHLYIGLHGKKIPPMALTFVQPDVALHAERMRGMGIEFDSEHFDNEQFHEAAFADPHGMHINLLEARTFSPPDVAPGHRSTCGYFSEVGIPVRDYTIGREFWENLGFVALEANDEPFARTSLMSNYLNIGLYRSRALRQPVLTFEDTDMPERLARLRELQLPLVDDMPDSLDANSNAVLIAPEGTRLLLLSSDE